MPDVKPVSPVAHRIALARLPGEAEPAGAQARSASGTQAYSGNRGSTVTLIPTAAALNTEWIDTAAIAESVRLADAPWGLTPREREVLRRIAAAETNSEIANALYVTVRTVETHVNAIYRKLGLADEDLHHRVAAAVFYLRAAGRIAARNVA